MSTDEPRADQPGTRERLEAERESLEAEIAALRARGQGTPAQLRALEREDWNQSRAARMLGVHRNTLIARLAAWGIRPRDRGAARQGMVGGPLPPGSSMAGGEPA